VETDVVADELGKLIFDQVVKHRKIRYDENQQDYPFSRKLDDRLLGREYELAIHVVSPFHEHTGNETILRAQSMGRDELLVLLPASDRLVRDLLMVLRTEKYIRQNISVTQQESIKRILTDKQFQNRDRHGSLVRLVESLLSQAKLIAAGHDVEQNGSEPQSRIVRGFHELLVRAYPNLRMLRGVNYSESDVGRFLRPSTTLYGSDEATFSEAEQEMLAFVQANSRGGLRTTLQALLYRFERKPYGWYLAAVQCILAKLCGRGKIEVRRDGTLLEDQELERALRNSHGYANLVLEPQIDFTAAQVRQLRDFHAEFFDSPPSANEARALGQETAVAFQTLHNDLFPLQQEAGRYPFLVALAAPLARLQSVAGQPYAFYFTELASHEDELFDLKEEIIDPLRRFMSGAPRQIYDEARAYLREQEPNLSYVEGDEAAQIQDLLADPACYRGNQIQQVKRLLDNLRAQVESCVQAEKAATVGKVEQRWQRLAGMAEFEEVTAVQQEDLQRPFTELKRTIERQILIAVIRDTLRRFDETQYPQLLRRMTIWAQPLPDETAVGAEGEKIMGETAVDYEIISRGALRVSFNKALLADEADVEAYVAAFKQALLQAIEDGKRIQI
jgi:hypothetical protein